MSDFSIPGVNDKYKTNELVNSLMEVERIPLKREQEKIDGFKFEQESWRRVNQYMSMLRDSSRSLFSFDNVFNNRAIISDDDGVLTATANRNAAVGKHSFTVIQIARSDRFLSDKIPKDFKVDAGNYVFKVGEKSVKLNWKGGTIDDFIASVNRRDAKVIRLSLVGAKEGEKNLLVESQITGEKNKLVFEEVAKTFAENIKLVTNPDEVKKTAFGKTFAELQPVAGYETDEVTLRRDEILIGGGNAVFISAEKFSGQKGRFGMTVFSSVPGDSAEVTNPNGDEIVSSEEGLSVEVQDAEILTLAKKIKNAPPEVFLPGSETSFNNEEVEGTVFARLKDGSEIALMGFDSANGQEFFVNSDDYGDIAGFVVRGEEGKTLSVREIAFEEAPATTALPINPVSEAADAIVEYEGIQLQRSENLIDDIVPNLTLTLNAPSEKSVGLEVSVDIEPAKDAIFEFVGSYNQLLAEMNILTQRRPEIIAEIQYFSDEEKDEAEKRLGLFSSEFTLTSSKNTLQRIMSSPYATDLNKTYTMLAQMGISSKTDTGSAMNTSQLRGYLEIDEKKLDKALSESMEEVQNIFGFDTNGDRAVDNGIAFLVDQNMQTFLNYGGILSGKTESLNSKIRDTETSIARMEQQLQMKEDELRRKYGQMSSSLRRLEEQSTSISNFNKANSGGN